MTIFQVEAEIPMAAGEYWEIRETAEFLEHQCIQLNLKSVEELERWTDGDKEYSKVKTIPNVNLPWMVRKMMGGKTLEFVDTHCKNINTPPYQATFSTQPPVMEDKIKITGTMTIVEVDAQNSKQVLEGEVVCSATGGGLIAKIITDNLKKSYKNIPDMVAKFKELMEQRKEEMQQERAAKEAADRKRNAEQQQAVLEAARKAKEASHDGNDLTATDATKEISIPDDIGETGDIAGDFDSVVSRPSQSSRPSHAAAAGTSSSAISIAVTDAEGRQVSSYDAGGDGEDGDASDSESELFFSLPDESPFLSDRTPSIFRALSPSKPFLHSRKRGSTLFAFSEDPETGIRRASYYDPAHRTVNDDDDDDDDDFQDAAEDLTRESAIYYSANGDLGESPEGVELRPRSVSRLRGDGRKKRAVTISIKPSPLGPGRASTLHRHSTAYQKMDDSRSSVSQPPPPPKLPWWKCGCCRGGAKQERKTVVSVGTM